MAIKKFDRSALSKFDPRPGRFAVEELGGSEPWFLELRGGLLPEIGAVFSTEQRGSSFTPLGASEGHSTVTGILYGSTDMTCSWDAPFMRASEILAQNVSVELTPAGLLAFFERLQKRGRECIVQVGSIVRRGMLEKVSPKPGRGHFLESGEVGSAGFNLEVTLTWRWAGSGSPLTQATPLATGKGVASKLAKADASLGAALAKAEKLLAPDALASLRSGLGRVRGSIEKLRRTVRDLGSLAQAPAQVVLDVLATARSLGNVLNDLEQTLGDTRDAYLAAGEAAKGVTQALGPRPSALALAAQVKGAIRGGSQDAMDAVCDVFDAIARRKRRRVAVRPGQSLADVARTELGAADRWPEIARINNIAGQVVPPGTTEVELPEGG